MKYLMKSEMAYVLLFRSKPFEADVMTQKCIRLGHDRFWYVADFYDHLEYNKELGTLSVM